MKKIILILIISGMFLSLGAINAAEIDVNTTSEGGLKKAVTDAPNDSTIYLDPGTYKGNNNTGIDINKNLTIVGKGPKENVIIDGEAGNWMFYVDQGYSLTLINITLQNGKASIVTGGAITNYEGTLILENCVFKNNSAVNGGSILSSGVINISDCLFIDNNASRDGGAIYHDGFRVDIVNSTFTNNTAGRSSHGGAIFVDAGNVSIADSIFNANNAWSHGGAIFAAFININITNSTFGDNNALNGHGGAIRTESSNVSVDDCTFINNTAAQDGGAFSNNGNHIGTNVNITKSVFINNTASRYGGAIENWGGIFNVSYSIFYNNTDPNNLTISNTNNDVNFVGDYNWWGTNNITGMYNGFTPNNHYIMKLVINNVQKYGDKLIITYLLLNNATNTDEDVEKLPLFSAILDYNGQTINIEDARNTQNFTTNVNDLQNSLTLDYYENTIATELFNVAKADTSLQIEIIGKKVVGETITIKTILKDHNGNLLVGQTVSFYVDGVKIGEAITDSNGVATLYHKFSQKGNYSISAKFNETEFYTESEIVTNMEIVENPTPGPEPNPNPPTPTPTPIPKPNNVTNGTNNNSAANAAMKNTGMPIAVIILILLSSLGLLVRKN